MTAGNSYELPFWDNKQIVMGIDEAGRGPCAGPLVVSGVVLPINYQCDDLNDSKQVSVKKRTMLYEKIKKDALFYIIVVVDVKEIDALNIYQATKKAMIECTKHYLVNGILTDAMPFQLSDCPVTSIIKGDQKSISIAAASILAKVTRDKIMQDYALLYPAYGFNKHKGYQTKEHKQALAKYGITPIHRLTYAPVMEVMQPNLFNFENK